MADDPALLSKQQSDAHADNGVLPEAACSHVSSPRDDTTAPGNRKTFFGGFGNGNGNLGMRFVGLDLRDILSLG